MANTRVYWAAEPESSDVAKRALDRVKAHREYLDGSGRADRMRRAMDAYNGCGPDGTKSSNRMLSGGEQGELVLATPPVFQTLTRQTERLLTGQKPAFKAIAANSDASTVAQVVLADQLIQAYDKRCGLEEREAEAVRSGLLMGSGWIVLEWATQEGEAIGANPDTGKVVREGDVRARFLTPWDVACDAYSHDAESREWVVTRTRANRWKLAAQYPQMADDITSFGARRNDAARPLAWEADAHDGDSGELDEDSVWLYEMRHAQAAQLPAGRMVRFLSPEVVLWDSGEAGYPYPELCAYEYAPERVLGSANGRSAHWDLLALQEAMDLILTIAVSNINVGGLVNYWVPPNASPNVHRLSTGMNIVESPVKPEALDSVSVSPEMMGVFELIKGLARESVGVNEVASGDVPKGMPAQLAALLEAKAAQYHQGGQRGYYKLVEAVRTGVLRLLQRFATSRRVVEVVGRAQSWALKEFQGEDIADVARIMVEPVNPIMRTFAGRMALADTLAERQWIGKEEYLSIWTTGEMHDELDPRKAREGRLAREKELLSQGKGLPPVDMQASMQQGAPVFGEGGVDSIRPLITDRHWQDIPALLTVLESPEARGNPEVVRAVLDLVQEKLRLWQQMSPDLLALLGGQPAPSAMMAMAGPPPGGPQGGPPGGPPPEGPGRDSGVGGPSPVAAMAEPGGGGPDIPMPSPPPSPDDGTQAPPPVLA